MRKQKFTKPDNEQLNNLDLEILHEIQEGFNKMDQFPIYTPDLQWFNQMVIDEQHNKKKKFVKDLTIFIIIAVIILTGIIVSLYQMPAIFIMLQIITTAFIVVYTGSMFGRKVSHNER
ncbi:YxlC family protein [Neobacillus sp. FSL H8-0543]|uniref:YxlC family protein n=1 Tax=Neobacillus sp. FSL H8-0543 TaxID=2954672 RepID=UPI0031593F70